MSAKVLGTDVENAKMVSVSPNISISRRPFYGPSKAILLQCYTKRLIQSFHLHMFNPFTA
jgi:hypothetical protein